MPTKPLSHNRPPVTEIRGKDGRVRTFNGNGVMIAVDGAPVIPQTAEVVTLPAICSRLSVLVLPTTELAIITGRAGLDLHTDIGIYNINYLRARAYTRIGKLKAIEVSKYRAFRVKNTSSDPMAIQHTAAAYELLRLGIITTHDVQVFLGLAAPNVPTDPAMQLAKIGFSPQEITDILPHIVGNKPATNNTRVLRIVQRRDRRRRFGL